VNPRQAISSLAALLLAVGLILGNVPAALAANTVATVGDFTYGFDEGNVGVGATVVAYSGGSDVVIPAAVNLGTPPITYPVRSIGGEVFANRALMSVVIPDSVVGIGSGAFANNHLTSIVIPDSVTTIGTNTFRGNGLTSATIGSSVTSIGERTFYDNSLTSISIPDSVTDIGVAAFQNNALTSVSIPSSVTNIGMLAFQNNALTSVNIPDSVTSIGYWAFQNNALTSATIGQSVAEIGVGAFQYNALTSLVLPASLTSIDNDAFDGNAITSVNIPGAVTSIGNKAFLGSHLTSLDIPDSVTSIGDFAFANNALTSISIGHSLSYLGIFAFYGNRLTSVVLPDTLGFVNNYGFASNQLTSVTLPASLTSISSGAFSGNHLTSVLIPDSVTEIWDQAFQGNALTSVAIPDSVTFIHSQAFQSNQLVSVSMGSAVATIGDYAFDRNPGLVRVDFLGPAPTTVGAADGARSLGDGTGLTVHYHAAFDSAVVPGGFTTPLWMGYRAVSEGADVAPPVVTGVLNQLPNSNGWTPIGAVVSWIATDPSPSSGSPTVPTPTTVGTEGAGQVITSSPSCDPAGNCAVGIYTLSVDATPPILTAVAEGQPNSAGWYAGDVAFDWHCGDALSEIDGTCPAVSILTGEGSTLTASAAVSDRAGNTTSASTPPVNIDRTPPNTSVDTPSGWSNQDVQVHLVAHDNLSGVAITSFRLDGGAVQTGSSLIVSGQGIHTLTYASTDFAGNREAENTTQIRIAYDGPNVTAQLSPPPNASGWNKSAVTVTATCDDALSGVIFCSAPVTLTHEGHGQVVTVIGANLAGNSTSRTVTVNIDTSPPRVVLSGPTSGGEYGLDSAPPATCTTTDPLSGVAVAAVPTVSRGASGHYTATCSGGLDAAGNAAAAVSATYLAVPTIDSILALTFQYLTANGAPHVAATQRTLANLLPLDNCASTNHLHALVESGNLTQSQYAELSYWAGVLKPSCNWPR